MFTELGLGKWCIPRPDLVILKGKGQTQLFFLKIAKMSSIGEECRRGIATEIVGLTPESNKIDRLVQWNVEVLSSLLCSIVSRPDSLAGRPKPLEQAKLAGRKRGNMMLDEVSEIISLPSFDASVTKTGAGPSTIQLDVDVVAQLEDMGRTIASMYRFVAQLCPGTRKQCPSFLPTSLALSGTTHSITLVSFAACATGWLTHPFAYTTTPSSPSPCQPCCNECYKSDGLYSRLKGAYPGT